LRVNREKLTIETLGESIKATVTRFPTVTAQVKKETLRVLIK